ncbi:MAG: mechanosensitive ion channel family protein [Flavobacteriaceae bacterium]|nr:mechanosensitive ion channel family protein [Flavobacteriaceae bacterium]
MFNIQPITFLQNNIINTGELNSIYNKIFSWVSKLNLDDFGSHMVTAIGLLLVFTILMFLLDYVLRNIILVILRAYSIKSKTKLDDILIRNKTFHNFTHLIPIALAKILFPIFFKGFPELTAFTVAVTNILVVIAVTLLVRSLIRSMRDYAKTKPKLADNPIDSYSQVASIILYCFAGIILYSILSGESPATFLVSLGAASAILMLVFKDTIMGFVASIQVSTNDMVRVGDWIEMTKFGADGTVLEINLSTVKVQNFDKTITTIPTYLLISDSFKNYRGMQNAGGRRIKRSINIKMSSIRFLEQEEIEQLKRIKLLAPFIEERQREIDDFNEHNQVDKTMPVNGRRMTNIGLFRAYIMRYAQQNPNIHKEFFLLVRHMQPTEHGLPLELYMFTNSTVWATYENVMADIFDHLLASISFFHLEVFELPSSDDIREFLNKNMK